MKNVAEFPKAKENVRMMFEIWSNLAGNSMTFGKTRSCTTVVTLVDKTEGTTKTGKPMLVCEWLDRNKYRKFKTYEFGTKQPSATLHKGATFASEINVQKNGFINLNARKDVTYRDIPDAPTEAIKKRTLFLFDIEVFKHDFLIEIKDYFTGEWFEFNNDLQGLRNFYVEYQDSLWIGYNNSGYDNHVLRAYLQGVDPYKVSKEIIDGERNSVYKMYDTSNTNLFNMDLYQDNRGFSLKEHCGFMGIDIRETQVDFDLDRPLTDDEKIKNRFYCRNDVLGTEKRLEQNSGMLLAKVSIAGMFNLDKMSVSMTNANLTGLLLKAVKTPDRKDDLKPYEIPEAFKIETEQVLNNYVGREFHRDKDDKLDVAIEVPRRDLVEVMGAGGLHGAKESYIRIGEFHFRDVGSLYPNTMRIFNHMSRNIPEEEIHIYGDLLDRRLKAKYSTEKTTEVKGVTIPTKVLINGIKLPLNTKYGAMGAKFNVLFDKRMRLHVCITGQLAMFDLLEKIEPHATIIQSNTDAHAFIPFSDEDAEAIDVICKDWEERTGYTLDDDLFKAMYQKDVNNYVAVDEHNHAKIKGAIGLTGGLKVSKAVVSNAFINYLLNGMDYVDFINQCDELRQYQIISKTGWSYQRTIARDINGKDTEAQKVNRVFAVKDPNKAVELFKVKEQVFTCKKDVIQFVKDSEEDKETEVIKDATAFGVDKEPKALADKIKEMVAKYNENKDENGEWTLYSETKGVPNAPEHYAISNEAVGTGITIEEIDKTYYIEQVEDLLIQWFGTNFKERIAEAHSNPDFEPLEVVNYIN